MGWRQGDASGAKGELDGRATTREGFGYWYPTMQVWQWRRTLSYWIAVTFFEGSLFFGVSSFLWCVPETLGRFKASVTTWGYVAGKVNFFICTYLMCLETINLSNADHHIKSDGSGPENGDHTEVSSESSGSDCDEENEPFLLWPFHVNTAVRKLERLGAGPWPYYASAIYFVGVLVFTVGLAADFITALPKEVAEWTLLIAFMIGSILFMLGGLAECIENKVFTTCTWDQGYFGALLNLLGGLGFCVGAVIGFFPGHAFASNFGYGVGSTIYALGSAVMIVMWKDEQFGLTFLAVLNQLGGPNGRPLVEGEQTQEELKTFSTRAAIFIMIYIATGVVSTYDFFMILANVNDNSFGLTLERAFNALLPCIFAHFMLALNAGVYRTPNIAPFHQLYIACRYLAVFMMANNLARMVQALMEEATYTASGAGQKLELPGE